MEKMEAYLNVRMPDDKMTQLKRLASERGLGYSAFARQVLFQELNRIERQGA